MSTRTSNADAPSATAPTGFVPGAPEFAPLPGATARFGYLNGAAYRIEMPVNWNGDLVLWAHGFHGWGTQLFPVSPPEALREAFVTEGYAWAASSYSHNGWVPGVGAQDTLALKREFARLVGAPARTYIVGQSMGGNAVVISLEQFPREYVGGLSLCGAVAGVEWIDYLWAWALAAEFIAGNAPQDAASPFEADVVAALGTPGALSPAGAAFEDIIRNLTGGPRPFFEEGFANAFEGNFGMALGDPARLTDISRAATTQGIKYQIGPGLGFDSATINRSVRRLIGDSTLRDAATHADSAPTTGSLGRPLLTLHETGDLTVPMSMEQTYRRKVEASGAGALLVQRLIRSSGHCAFSDGELLRGWEDLRAWVADGARPAGDDVFGDLANAGRTFTDPLRTGDPAR
ncbi:MAG: hypothetical protein AB7J35_12735 [Dehalococcoidia bacterium]